jgi:hypothetical protein
MDNQDINNDFRRAMVEWSELKDQLKGARKDLKVLNTREKDLNLYIKKFMDMKKIDACKVKQNKVSLAKKTSRGGLTRDTVLKGLTEFFEYDNAKAESAMNAILDARPTTERQTLTVSKLKGSDDD